MLFNWKLFPGTNLQDLNLDWIINFVKMIPSRLPKFSDHHTWLVYDYSTEEYYDSGEPTGGEPGKSPIIGVNGNWYVWNDEVEGYVDTGTKARGVGVPAGGADGDVLIKNGAVDYEAIWVTSPFARNTEIALLIEGNIPMSNVNKGQYVILRNSTISGKTDGLYRAEGGMTSGVAIDSSYLSSQITIGGLNAVTAVTAMQTATVDTSYTDTSMYYARWWRSGNIVVLNLNFKVDSAVPTNTTLFTLSNIPLPAVASIGLCVSATSSQFVGMLELGAPSNILTLTTGGTMQAGNYIRTSFTYICL